jgi:small conductance mechanosensitive channel
MTAPALAGVIPGVQDSTLIAILIGLAVLVVFVIGSRITSNIVVSALERRHMRTDAVVVAGRVVTFLLISLGVLFAVGVAFQSQNLTLAGIVLATIVASIGVQDLLKDYVSGYYVLLERHIRAGDRISMDGVGSGTVTEVKLRVTLLKTEAGDLLVIPNSELFNKPVVVHVHAAERAAETKSAPPE